MLMLIKMCCLHQLTKKNESALSFFQSMFIPPSPKRELGLDRKNCSKLHPTSAKSPPCGERTADLFNVDCVDDPFFCIVFERPLHAKINVIFALLDATPTASVDYGFQPVRVDGMRFG